MAWLHTAEWAARDYVRAGRRLLGVVVAPETAPELIEELRELARGVLPELMEGDEVSAPSDQSDGTNHTLRIEGAALLHRSRDVRYSEDAHPAYERILTELAPDSARILRLLLLDGAQPSVDVRTGGPLGPLSSRLIAPGLTMIGARAGCRYVERVPSYHF